CLFVGYTKETKGYYFYNPSEQKVFVARTGVFLEKEFISKGTSGRKVELEEIQEQQGDIEPEMEPEQTPQDVVVQESVPVAQSPRRSGRIRREPERYGFLVTHTGDVMLMDQDEPTTYQQAMSGPDSEKWLMAMKSEMES
ncbi:hypothetical protein, partial [Escherichia coli]|uniref:hypothetical protein n=1 Tax=Escherichia coli TaxID=562 RepID=UPI00200D2D85